MHSPAHLPQHFPRTRERSRERRGVCAVACSFLHSSTTSKKPAGVEALLGIGAWSDILLGGRRGGALTPASSCRCCFAEVRGSILLIVPFHAAKERGVVGIRCRWLHLTQQPSCSPAAAATRTTVEGVRRQGSCWL